MSFILVSPGPHPLSLIKQVCKQHLLNERPPNAQVSRKGSWGSPALPTNSVPRLEALLRGTLAWTHHLHGSMWRNFRPGT